MVHLGHARRTRPRRRAGVGGSSRSRPGWMGVQRHSEEVAAYGGWRCEASKSVAIGSGWRQGAQRTGWDRSERLRKGVEVGRVLRGGGAEGGANRSRSNPGVRRGRAMRSRRDGRVSCSGLCLTDDEERCLLDQPMALQIQCIAAVCQGLNTGSLIQHIFTAQIYDFVLPLPPEAEHDAIVRRLEAFRRILLSRGRRPARRECRVLLGQLQCAP